MRACVRACVCVLNFYFAYLSLRHRTIFYIGTLLILMACVCVCVRACVRACERARSCRCEYVRCFVSANGLLVDVCQCCCLLMFVCLPLSRHFPCCSKHSRLHANCFQTALCDCESVTVKTAAWLVLGHKLGLSRVLQHAGPLLCAVF